MHEQRKGREMNEGEVMIPFSIKTLFGSLGSTTFANVLHPIKVYSCPSFSFFSTKAKCNGKLSFDFSRDAILKTNENPFFGINQT